MFWRKKNLKLIHEITPTGKIICKLHIPNGFNYSFLSSFLIEMFSGNPQTIYGTCSAIDFWGEKEGWQEAAQDIINEIVEMEKKKLNLADKRNPLIVPSEVISTFRKNLMLKD
jgi:hypothetical protein